MKMLRVAALVALAFALPRIASADFDVSSAWKNEYGSVLTITAINPDGSFQGQYVNNASGFGCQGTPYPVIGWISGVTIGWTVTWTNGTADCNSITSWAGSLVSGDTIETMWSLGYQSPNFGPRVMIGTDFFTRQ